MPKKGKKSGFGIAGAHARPHWALASALVASTVVTGGLAKPAMAQHVESRQRGPQVTPAPAQEFDIPAGSLANALVAFETATGLKIDLRVDVEGIETKGVSGEFTPQQALHQLLEGTGIRYVFAGKNTVVLREKESENVLSAVNVSEVGARPGAVSSPKYRSAPVNIPQTITVVPQTVIQQQNVTSLRDAVRNVPGITMSAGEGGNYPGDKFNVRGFTAQSDMFVNGVRDIGAYSRDIFNLEQVEVTKGPNSAISGRGSTGGAINMVTKTPKPRNDRVGTITIGSANQRRATVDMNQSLDVLGYPTAAVRLNAVTSEGGVPGNEVMRNKNWGIAPSLAIGLGTPTQVNLSYIRSEQDNIPSYGPSTYDQVPSINTRKFFGLRGLDFERVSSNGLTLRVDHNFGRNTQLTNQTVRQASEVNRIVTPATYTPPANPGDPVPANHGNRAPKTHAFDNDIVTNQTNLATTFKTGSLTHNVTAGFEVSREHSDRGNLLIDTTGYGAAPKITDFTRPSADADYTPSYQRVMNRRVKATSLGAYLFESVQIHPKIEVSGGLRWDSYDPEYVDSASLASGVQAKKSSAVSGRAAVTVKPTANSSMYVSYGTSFNPSNENLALDALDTALVKLDPEKSRTYEVGSKWELFKQRLLATFAIFRTEKYNARTSNPADPSVGTILAGKVRSQGGEVGLIGDINPRWNVMAGYSYLEAKTLASLDTSKIGAPELNVPKHSVSLWTNYQLSPAFSVGGGARYVDKRLLRNTETVTTYVPSYHTYDLVAAYKLNPYVDLRLNLQNLSDKLYYDSGRMWTPAPGRSVALTTTVKF
jgi:catecholate siderophore receptor